MAITPLNIERFIGRFSIGRDSNPLDITGSPHFLRVKVPGGFITSNQLRGVAGLTARYSRELAEITDRQSIQLHWIGAEEALEAFSALNDMGFTTDMCGQGFRGARYGDVRNIVCCPVSGIEEGELLDGEPLMRELTGFFVGNSDFLDMPRKFKFSISGCGRDCTRAQINDLALVAVERDGEAGYTALMGGSVGASLPGPRIAKYTGAFIRPEDAFDFAVAVIELYRDNGNRESKAKARFKWLLETWGLDKFLTMLKERLGGPLERYDGPVFSGRGEHVGVQPQSQEGHHYINVPIPGGRLTAHEMVRFAELADEYGRGDLRLTPAQNIMIPHVKEKEALLKALKEGGFSLEGPALRWTSMGCSSDFCGKTRSPHAKEVLNQILHHLEQNFDKAFLDEADLVLHINGCPNNCCASNIAEIGLNGKLKKEGGEMVQTYDVSLGGGFGPEPIFGRLVAEKVAPGELGAGIASLLEIYRERRRASESLGDFCRKHSVDELRRFFMQQEVEK